MRENEFNIFHDCLVEYFFTENILCEERHIMSHLGTISDDIMHLIVQKMYDFKIKEYSENEFVNIFTDWSFTSVEDRNSENFDNVDDIPEMFVKTYDEEQYHPIYISFKNISIKEPYSALISREINYEEKKRIINDAFKTSVKNDRIDIVINYNKTLQDITLNDFTLKPFISSVVAHELFHAAEAYMLRYENILNHAKNSLYRDFFTYDFVLDKNKEENEELKKTISMLLYYMTPEEQRARLNQIHIFVDKLISSKPSEFRSQLWRNLQIMLRQDFWQQRFNNKLHMAVCAVLKMSKTNSITMLYSFYSLVQAFQNPDIDEQMLVVIAYSLFAHSMLDFKSENLSNGTVEKYLTKQNVKWYLEGTGLLMTTPGIRKSIVNSARISILNNYKNYVKRIYENISENMKPFLNMATSQFMPPPPEELEPEEMSVLVEKLLSRKNKK